MTLPLSEKIRRPHPLRLPVLREPDRVIREAERIRRRWPDAGAEDPDADPEALAIEMDRRRRSNEWQGFYWMDATRTAVAFLGSRLWGEIRFSELFEFLLHQVGADGNLVYTHAVFRKYLETFDSRSDRSRKLASVLKRNWKKGELSVGQWVEDLCIFEPHHAPGEVAKYMASQGEPFQALRQSGVESPHGEGLMQEAHLRFVEALEPCLHRGESESVEKMLGWLKPMDAKHPLQGVGAGKAMDALLSAWVQHDPPPSIKEIIKSRLVDAYGDPRINPAGAWSSCSEEARRVMMKWMIGATIKMFFDIVTEAERSHMWRNRKGLWIDLYEEDRITEAWFALSASGMAIAQRLARESESATLQCATNQSRDGQDRRKCLLIMKVDGRWVVEGSHSFKTHIFPRGDNSPVTPYEDSYTCEQFRSYRGPHEPLRFVHHSNWRNKVLGELSR
ncbi:MAG: EH signature domain-containing protein [Gammaproteobacteria bacterium]|nr:EH signature domain-containing protein [Gammaproteobacteria bacterium]